MPTGTALLSDGTIVEFEWVYPDAPEYAWVLNESHHAHGRTPMQQWFEVAGTAGHDRAWSEIGVPPFSVFHRFQTVGPFHYSRATMDPPERMGEVIGALGPVLARYGGSVGFWQEHCTPRIRAACEELATLPDDVPLQLAADTFEYGLHQTFTSVLGLFTSVMPMATMLDAVGLNGRVVAQQVAQGGTNASQEIDAELFDLAQRIADDPDLVAAATAGTPAEALAALRQDPAAATFVAALDALVAQHARRSGSWDFHEPTWGERPEAVLALVRVQLSGSAPTPAEVAARSDAAAAEAMATALAALPPEQHEQFRTMAAGSAGYVGVREGRAYWQMVLCGSARDLLLRIGQRLVREGRLDQPDDVLWLEPAHFEGTTGDLRDRAAARRSEWQRLVHLTPPQQIGTTSPEFAPPAAVSTSELRGFAASRGRVTGVARVLDTADDGDRLEPGDILVCRITTPSWTPLFGIAGAVVTEAGDSTSHPAITAREYGIPAVLHVTDACRLIPDGATVTVDGSAGTVTLSLR